MNIRELIDRLEGIAQSVGADQTVILAFEDDYGPVRVKVGAVHIQRYKGKADVYITPED